MVSYGSTEAGAVANGVCVTDRKPHPLLSPLYGLFMQSRLVSGFIRLEQFIACEHSLAGKVDKNVEVAIVDPATGVRMAVGEQGEICIRSHRVMRYAGPSGAEDAGPSADGWFRSGDLGCLDANGHLIVAGRIKRIISRGGEKISPVEIEQALLKLPRHRIGVRRRRAGRQIRRAGVRLRRSRPRCRPPRRQDQARSGRHAVRLQNSRVYRCRAVPADVADGKNRGRGRARAGARAARSARGEQAQCVATIPASRCSRRSAACSSSFPTG
ncbi:hypothetical protein [Cohnella rhizosphaerae]